MKDEIETGSISESSYRLRKRQAKKSKRKMAVRHGESRSGRPGRPSAMVPLVILVVCLATFTGSSTEYLSFFRRHRTLLTLTPEHVNQYPFSNFLEVSQHQPASQKKVVGFYWQIPRCGGTTLKHILGTCLRQAAAARTSADYCDMNTDTIQTCPTKVGTFVNADPSDHGGIQRCERMGLIQSGVPDVIVSSRILHAATLFDPDHKGRLFTILRNPIERAVSTFFYLQNAYWERHYRPELKEMTILDYAALPDTANNWMTRWLTGKNAEPHLTQEDLTFAKELLRRKFLILLTDDMGTSVERLLYYMDWRVPEEHFQETKQCLLANTRKDQGQNRNKHLMPEEGSPEYEALKAINNLDMQLFEYAQQLFKEQEEVIMKRKHKRTSELFIEDETTGSARDAVGKASQSSEYEAALAAAKLMERPPDSSTMKSVEATNNLVATALMIKINSTAPHRKDESAMIASVMSKRQGSANKWDQFRGVAAVKQTPIHQQAQATTSNAAPNKQTATPDNFLPQAVPNPHQTAGSNLQQEGNGIVVQQDSEAGTLQKSSRSLTDLQPQAQATQQSMQPQRSMSPQTPFGQANQVTVSQQVQQQQPMQQQSSHPLGARLQQQSTTSQKMMQQQNSHPLGATLQQQVQQQLVPQPQQQQPMQQQISQPLGATLQQQSTTSQTMMQQPEQMSGTSQLQTSQTRQQYATQQLPTSAQESRQVPSQQ